MLDWFIDQPALIVSKDSQRLAWFTQEFEAFWAGIMGTACPHAHRIGYNARWLFSASCFLAYWQRNQETPKKEILGNQEARAIARCKLNYILHCKTTPLLCKYDSKQRLHAETTFKFSAQNLKTPRSFAPPTFQLSCSIQDSYQFRWQATVCNWWDMYRCKLSVSPKLLVQAFFTTISCSDSRCICTISPLKNNHVWHSGSEG